MSRMRCAVVVVLGALLVAGCGERATPTAPSAAVQRDTATRFAVALLHGDAAGARALVAAGSDGALGFLVQRAIAPWKGGRTSLRLPAQPVDTYWTVSFARMRAGKKGSFVRQQGNLVISVVATSAGPRIAFFTLENVRTRFSTHRDSQLLPSKR